MTTWTIALKNLRRRPTRSLLTAFGLSIAVAAVVALVGVSQSLESSFLKLYNGAETWSFNGAAARFNS